MVWCWMFELNRTMNEFVDNLTLNMNGKKLWEVQIFFSFLELELRFVIWYIWCGFYVVTLWICMPTYPTIVCAKLDIFLLLLMCRVDMRSNTTTGDSVLIHKKGSKVTCLHCHPHQPDILLSCGNDHFVSFYFYPY